MSAPRPLLAAIRLARRAHEDEDGGSMVFGALTLFALVLFTFLVYQVGMTSGDRMQLQGAADAAAYSGALVEAESLESIAFLNDGMAFVYYEALRYAVDAAVYGTLHAFERHDDWVRTREPWRLEPCHEKPWDILETNVSDNNPGANDPAPTAPWNYVPQVDPLHHGPRKPERRDYSWVELGAQGGLFRRRHEAAVRRALELVPRAKLWLADLHDAERIVLAATPRLVERACAKVALENGAEWVGVSDDLDSVFRVTRGCTQSRSLAGFTDGGDEEERVDAAFARRCQTLANPVEKKARQVPCWFSARTGESRGGEDPFGLANAGYSQTRLCWNRRDWEHEPDPAATEAHGGSPKGHWHVAHQHHLEHYVKALGKWIPAGPPLGSAFDHDFGHGILSGPDAGMHAIWFQPDEALPSDHRIRPLETHDPRAPHHAVQRCPTCAARGQTASGFATVTHTQKDAERFFQEENGRADLARVRFEKGKMPRPIRARGQVFRAGVTVATWRPCRGLGTVLHGSPFGLVAIASAQVGVRRREGGEWVVAVADTARDDEVVFTDGRRVKLSAQRPEGDERALENLYLGTDSGEGVRFGARLVPIARTLTFGDAAGRGGSSRAEVDSVCGSALARLLHGKRAKWFDSPDGEGVELPAALRERFEKMRASLDVASAAFEMVH